MASSLKYVKIRNQILNNALIAGSDRLPSEKEICSLYNVSRTTAIKALNSLADDNLVRREVGRGTFFNASNVASTVYILVDGTFPDMPSFLKEVTSRLQEKDPLQRIEICQVKPRDWVHAIAVNPGVKLIIATHIGYLAEMGLLQPLNKLDEFYDIASNLREEYIEWHHIRPHEPACYSLPFSVDPWLFGYDRVRAKELGLNAATGPESFSELIEWMKVAAHSNCESSMLRRDEPLSEYLTFSAGKQFIREENGEVSFNFDFGEEWIKAFRDLYDTGWLHIQREAEQEPLTLGRSLVGFSLEGWLVRQAEEAGVLDRIALRLPPPMTPGAPSFCNIGIMSMALAGCGASDREKASAVRVLRHLLTEPEVHRMLLKYRSTISANRSIYEEQQSDGKWMPFIQGLSMGRKRCDHPAQHKLSAIVKRYFYDSIKGQISPKDAARKIRDACRLQIEIEHDHLCMHTGQTIQR